MCKLIINYNNKSTELNVAEGALLSDILAQAVPFAMPCGGNHSCGKCKLKASGNLSQMSAEEKAFLTEDELAKGIRLACFTEIQGDAEATIASGSTDVLSALKLPSYKCSGQGFGLATDIGTTTVAMRLYRLENGEVLAEELAGNAQEGFGADVISRISAAKEQGTEALKSAICSQLTDMAGKCVKKAGISKADKSVVTGNTTMLHFYEGLDASGIAVSPFTPASLFGCSSANTMAGSGVYLPECIGPYIGADISCAILASEMTEHPDTTRLLADLGTNGELALWHNNRLYCASTAAGPAFEGASLSCGMRAGLGAITKLWTNGKEVFHETSGGGEAKGICGSGILDAVAVMKELGIIDETGYMDPDCGFELEEYADDTAWRIPGTEVFITQKDIRQIQLAKSAIHAGIMTLLSLHGLKAKDVESFCVAGGFGHYMNPESAAAIGLFPAEFKDRMNVLGNAALAGASLLVLDAGMQGKLSEIVQLAEEIPLSGNNTFSELYMDSMYF